MTNRTKFLYDEDGKAIGRVDSHGNIYTMKARPSRQYIPTKHGMAINKSHMTRVAIAEQMES